MTHKTIYLNEMQSLMGLSVLRDYKLTPKESINMVYKKDYNEVQEKYKLVLLDVSDQFLYLNDNQWIDKDQLQNRFQIMDGNHIDYIIINKISYHDDGVFVRSKTRVLDSTIGF